jgi:hypothetical protein
MSTGAFVYSPPESRSIRVSQNGLPALRLLLAQRKLYNLAKRWSFLRWIGFSVIAIVAPIVTALLPRAAVVVGAIAGIWIFLARTWFKNEEQSRAAQGAGVQERFDHLVFAMPSLALREPSVSPEEVSELSGEESSVHAAAEADGLLDWYPVDDRVGGATSVAIAQRANAAYAERLLRANANLWLFGTTTWLALAVVLSIALEMRFETFLLGVALPLLPALLDVWEQWRATKQAGITRRSMADGIERLVRGRGDHPLSGEDLLVWQDQLYHLRRSAPQIPNLVYKRMRTRNEKAMNAAAAELTAAALGQQGAGGSS